VLPARITCTGTKSDNSPPYETDGFVPFVGSPLAVTPVHLWYADEGWRLVEGRGWHVTHVPTGCCIGSGSQAEFATAEKAMAFLMRLDPTFGAWPIATPVPEGPVITACKAKFRLAMEGTPK
jgi:hypothetical protein